MKTICIGFAALLLLGGCNADSAQDSPAAGATPATSASGENANPIPDAKPQTPQVVRPEVTDRVPVDSSPTTKIVMLGTGTPVPTPDRSGPAVAIVVGDESYLFDFGPGVVRQSTALSPRFGGPFLALRGKSLNTAFLTHLHSDHTAGFADLLLTGWSGGHRNTQLKLFGPKGVQDLVDGTHAAFEDDIRYRIDGLEDTNDRGWRVEVTDVSPGVVYTDDNVKVSAIPVLHGSWTEAYGYRIETDDKVVVISGDLRPSPAFEAELDDVDYLIHEVYCARGLVDNMTPVRQAYHRSNHTSTVELAEIANRVKPEVLVLTHILPFGCPYSEILEEVESRYDGKVILANDLDIYR